MDAEKEIETIMRASGSTIYSAQKALRYLFIKIMMANSCGEDVYWYTESKPGSATLTRYSGGMKIEHVFECTNLKTRDAFVEDLKKVIARLNIIINQYSLKTKCSAPPRDEALAMAKKITKRPFEKYTFIQCLDAYIIKQTGIANTEFQTSHVFDCVTIAFILKKDLGDKKLDRRYIIAYYDNKETTQYDVACNIETLFRQIDEFKHACASSESLPLVNAPNPKKMKTATDDDE